MVCGANSVYCSYAHILNPLILARGLLLIGEKSNTLNLGEGGETGRARSQWDGIKVTALNPLSLRFLWKRVARTVSLLGESRKLMAFPPSDLNFIHQEESKIVCSELGVEGD